MRTFLRGLTILLLCACLLSGACVAEQVIDPVYAFRYFIELLQAESYSEALEMYRDIQKEPKYLTAVPEFPVYELYAEGLQALQDGKLEEALKLLENAQLVGGSESADFPDMEGLYPCTTVIAYIRGLLAMRDKQYQTALDCFDQCKNYKDSNTLAIGILNTMEHRQDRYKLTGTETTDSTATLSWEDTKTAGGYNVSYWISEKQKETVRSSECSVTLENLLPETGYTVSIAAEDDAEESLHAVFETKQAEELQGAIRTAGRGILRYYEAKNAEKYNNDFTKMSNKGLILDAEQTKNSDGTETGLAGVYVKKGYESGEYIYDYCIPLSNTDETITSFSWMMILRVAHGSTEAEESVGFDVYAVTGTSEAPAVSKSFQPRYRFPVSELLAMHFNAYDRTWLEGPGIIELYINGMFADKTEIGIMIK